MTYDYIAAEFHGNTSDALAFYYDPPACLRLLDPDLDLENRFFLDESLMREASALSKPDRILREPSASMPRIYHPEPEHGWCYYFEKAELARQFGDWEEVVKLGKQAFKLDDSPNNPVERFVFIEGNLGCLYEEKKLFNKSIAAYQQAIKINPGYDDAYYNLGVVYLDTGSYDEAIEVFQKALTKNPGNHEVRYNLGVTYAKKGLYHDAVAACEKLLESDPGNAHPLSAG